MELVWGGAGVGTRMILAPTAHHRPGRRWRCPAAGASGVLGGDGVREEGRGRGRERGVPLWARVSHSDSHSTITFSQRLALCSRRREWRARGGAVRAQGQGGSAGRQESAWHPLRQAYLAGGLHCAGLRTRRARVWGPPSAGTRAAGRPHGGRQPHASARPPPMTHMYPPARAAAAGAACVLPVWAPWGSGEPPLLVWQPRAACGRRACMCFRPESGQDRGAPWRCLHMQRMARPCTRTGPVTRVGADAHMRSCILMGAGRHSFLVRLAGWPSVCCALVAVAWAAAGMAGRQARGSQQSAAACAQKDVLHARVRAMRAYEPGLHRLPGYGVQSRGAARAAAGGWQPGQSPMRARAGSPSSARVGGWAGVRQG